MDYKRMEQLNNLHKSGALTDEEFEKEKKKIMDEEESANPNLSLPMGLNEGAYLPLMSFLILIPYIGWILPIVLWIIGKEQSPLVNKQGKYILNWYITWFIGGIIFWVVFAGSFIASLASGNVFTGSMFYVIPIAMIFGLLALLFPIIGGIKGLNKQTYKYPLSIPFFK